MSQLIPCPDCNRHVRQSEASCPFCGTSLSLGDVPAHVLPRSRLGRAATFAFGATLVGATALVGCGGDSEEGKKGHGGAGSGGTSASGGSSSGGSNAGQSSGGTHTVTPVYGAPAAGTGPDSQAGTSSGGSANAGTSNGGGTAGPVYGAPPSGGGGAGNFPVYGAAPAD